MIHIDFTSEVIYVEGDDQQNLLATFELYGPETEISVQRLEPRPQRIPWVARARSGSSLTTLCSIREPGSYHIRSAARGRPQVRDIFLEIIDHQDGLYSLVIGAGSTRSAWVIGNEVVRETTPLPLTVPLRIEDAYETDDREAPALDIPRPVARDTAQVGRAPIPSPPAPPPQQQTAWDRILTDDDLGVE